MQKGYRTVSEAQNKVNHVSKRSLKCSRSFKPEKIQSLKFYDTELDHVTEQVHNNT